MNWGWRIAIFLSAFIIFIMSMVISSFGNKVDLVSEDYYQKELDYQQTIDAKKNAFSIKDEVVLNKTDKGLVLSFPKTFMKQISEGRVKFFRPDNSDLDKISNLELKDFEQLFSYVHFKPGFYKVYIDFKVEEDSYHIEKSIHF